jgi:hypothetical protein
MFFAVAAASAASIWAVGVTDFTTSTGCITSGTRCLKTLAAHWDGNAWQQVPTPAPPGGDDLDGVAAASIDST